jgi:hypothetical protein
MPEMEERTFYFQGLPHFIQDFVPRKGIYIENAESGKLFTAVTVKRARGGVGLEYSPSLRIDQKHNYMPVVENARVSSFTFQQFLFRLPACGIIDDRKATLRSGCGGHCLDLHMDVGLSILLERHFACLFDHARKDLSEKGSEVETDFRGKKKVETPADQQGALDPEERGAGEVRGTDNPIPVEGKIADRGEIVDIRERLQGSFQLIPGIQEFRVLQLQLDLVDLQFVKKPLRFGLCPGRARFCRFRAQKVFRPATQFGGFSCLSFVFCQE